MSSIKLLLLQKIRLSTYFGILFVLFFLTMLFLPRIQLTDAQLALFSVNSFLYGFYISPILRAQKKRIDEIHKAVRAEASAIFELMIKAKPISSKSKDEFKDILENYLLLTAKQEHAKAEAEYEKLISYCIEYKGKNEDDMDELLEGLVKNQENRTEYYMEISNKIYSNEWLIMSVLFIITLAFILMVDTGDNLIIRTVTALLSTGLTMLMLILIKLDSLTHKKAKGAYKPYVTLVESNFYHIDEVDGVK